MFLPLSQKQNFLLCDSTEPVPGRLLLICAAAFGAIAEAQAKNDTQFLLASLDATGRLWEAARIPLCVQMCYHASECLGPFVWAAFARARQAAAGTLADAVVQSVAARAGLD